ncbi:RING finger protein ETP1 [Hypsizygus marmoreus]|uniref:RING finger protein ETP1 n=1 Tax=Hypsizygus marmoreus TaxID=39966 RepID=A0A369JRA4_HYPMA|nr:RING finger protein ETP1 [Hypsizygus marmoreus]
MFGTLDKTKQRLDGLGNSKATSTGSSSPLLTSSCAEHSCPPSSEMRGYHIRLTLYRKAEISQSQPHATDSFIPSRLFQHLPAHKPKSTNRRNALFNPQNKDYRFGPIRIDWVDFEQMSKAPYSAVGKEKEHGRGTVEATFVSNTRTKTGSTNLPEGVVHIFRDSATKPSQEELESTVSTSTVDDSDGVMLGVLAVPSWMTPSDFLAFVAPAAEGMAHLRLICDCVPNRSIAVIKFFNPADAAEFVEAYNGKPFNSMEPEICNVVHVLSVKVEADDTVSQAISRLGSAQSSMYELPTCPVCLERMDSAITGLITVPCSHTFHCTCLSKWGDSRCPVSRSAIAIPFANPSTPMLSACSSCSSTTNLWICLICGNIGCGRYGRAHAQAHYQSTTHLYALELETQRVWDYAGDGYVHRLIQNKADGKLVELPSAASSTGISPRDGGLGPSQADALSAEKIEAIGIEYSYLLTSQLDSQRSYYEEQTTELKNQVAELRGLVERLSHEFDKERANAKEGALRHQQEEDMRLAKVLRDKTKAEARAEKATELARKFDKELKEERAVSEGLMKNIGKMKERVEQAEEEKKGFIAKIQDMEDQLRDVMFFLETKTKIENGEGPEAELAGGSIEVPVPKAETKKKKKRK